MRQSLGRGGLGERAIADVELHCSERDAVVFDDDHFETILQHPSLDNALELGALGENLATGRYERESCEDTD